MLDTQKQFGIKLFFIKIIISHMEIEKIFVYLQLIENYPHEVHQLL